ncbi:MAG: rRNA pseudouridine synthase [Nitrospirae bacterium]|nr:rRNA pseudouridine synthase [Nitrospirota bacterium]
MEERLQKILSKSGIASRRKAEEMILEGRVMVNGKTATLGMKADPDKDHIKVDGRLISRPEPKVYIILNKPKKYITSTYDPEGRPTIMELLKGIRFKVFPVGRLDFDTEGLLILTNDGELANAVLHPKRKIPKTYSVKVDGILDDADVMKLEKGIKLEDGLTAPCSVKRIRKAEANSWIEMTIYEGRKRQIRRMLDKIGHSVIRLKRIRINGLELEDLPPGSYRYFTAEELKRFKTEVMGRSQDFSRRGTAG